MRVTATVLIIIGWLLVVVNFLAYLAPGVQLSPKPGANSAEIWGFYIGTNLLLIVGGLLLWAGYKLRKKSKVKSTRKKLLDNFLNDQPGNAAQ